MPGTKWRYALVVIGVLALAFLGWSLSHRPNDSMPTEPSVAGSSPAYGTPDDPAPTNSQPNLSGNKQ